MGCDDVGCAPGRCLSTLMSRPCDEGDMGMPQALPQYLWMNGQLVPFQDATIHVSTAAAFYATNVFEGIRIYWNAEAQEAYAFRLQEHFMRWFESMKMMRF